MPKTVYITNAMSSTLNSSYEFSRRLAELGHEVTYLSHIDIAEQIATFGYHFVQLTRDRELRDEYRNELSAISNRNSPSGIFKRLQLGRKYYKQSAVQSEIEETIKSLAPDLLIIDIECHFAILACRNLGIPIALPIVWPTVFRDWSLPPLHSSQIPAAGLMSKLRSSVAWLTLLVQRGLSHFFLPLAPRKFKLHLKPIGYATNRRFELKRVAAARGIRLKEVTDWQHWLKPHVYKGMDVLCFNAIEFEFPHQPDDRIIYVGPMVFEQRNEISKDAQQVQVWERFRDRANRNEQKLVYCSLGTYWSTDKSFLRKLNSVFEHREDWALVIGLGGKLDPIELGSLPKNVIAMEFAPQVEILKSAAAAITHGGVTSINECLLFEVPVLCCSTGFVDQNGCCARVEYHGVGLQMDIKAATTERLRNDLQELLTSDDIRRRVKAMSESFRAYRANGVLESYVQSVVNTS